MCSITSGWFSAQATIGLGHEQARTDGVDGDAARRPVGSGGTGEMDQRSLGRLVVPAADPAIGDEAADRGYIDDASAASLQHLAADDLGADEAMRQVEVDEFLPGPRSVSSMATSRLRPPTLLTRMSIGPASASTRSQSVSHVAGSAISAAYAQTLAASISRPLPRFLQDPRGIAGLQHDIRTGIRQRQRYDATKASASAGYERAFPVETKSIENVHRNPPPAARLVAIVIII